MNTIIDLSDKKITVKCLINSPKEGEEIKNYLIKIKKHHIDHKLKIDFTPFKNFIINEDTMIFDSYISLKELFPLINSNLYYKSYYSIHKINIFNENENSIRNEQL